MKLRVADSDGLKQWLQQRRSYTSHEVQNEMLRIMAHQILRSILKDIYTSMWFCVSADETVDISLIEQVHDYTNLIITYYGSCNTLHSLP